MYYCSRNLSNDSFDNIYLYKLKLKINNIVTFFEKPEIKTYSTLIDNKNKIKYEDIQDYEINIEFFDNVYELKNTISHPSSCHTNQDSNIYIEFSQDTFGFVNCICYIINKDLNSLCISPP